MNYHVLINNSKALTINQSGKLEELSTTEESSVVQQVGKRQVKRKVKIYNLDAIISPLPHESPRVALR